MPKTPTFLLLALTAVSLARADTPDPSPTPTPADTPPVDRQFAQRQKAFLADIDKRLQVLEDMRDCVAGATRLSELRICRLEASGSPGPKPASPGGSDK